MTREIYLFSGLGADERMFQKIDFTGYSITHIKWNIPVKGESIEHYATRLLNQIPSQKPTLVGLSFGGLIAIEVAKQIQTEHIILISSAKNKKEIPFYFRICGIIGLHKLLPIFLLKRTNFVTNWIFSVKSINEKKLLKSILKDTDSIFLKWAIEKIVKWNNVIEFDNLKHIHGNKDRLLPIKFVSDTIKINQGGHLMILNKWEEISENIKKILN